MDGNNQAQEQLPMQADPELARLVTQLKQRIAEPLQQSLSDLASSMSQPMRSAFEEWSRKLSVELKTQIDFLPEALPMLMPFDCDYLARK